MLYKRDGIGRIAIGVACLPLTPGESHHYLANLASGVAIGGGGGDGCAVIIIVAPQICSR